MNDAAKKKKKKKDKDKAKLKKPAPAKKEKRVKPIVHDEDEPAEIELEPEEHEEFDEESEGEPKPGGPKRKGRPPKSTSVLDVEDDFDPDALPDNDEVGDQDLTIPRKPRKSAALDEAARNGDDPAKPQTRLGLIRARHEAMRREIDQIREDLETEEEE